MSNFSASVPFIQTSHWQSYPINNVPNDDNDFQIREMRNSLHSSFNRAVLWIGFTLKPACKWMDIPSSTVNLGCQYKQYGGGLLVKWSLLLNSWPKQNKLHNSVCLIIHWTLWNVIWNPPAVDFSTRTAWYWAWNCIGFQFAAPLLSVWYYLNVSPLA